MARQIAAKLQPYFLMLALAFLPLAMPSAAAKVLPPELEQWQDWVLQNHPGQQCPHLYNAKQKYCLWYSPLQIKAGNKGASFSWRVENHSQKPQWLTLPGSNDLWPHKLSSNGSLVAISSNNHNRPAVLLEPGEHQLVGEINWDQIPSSIEISPTTGLVELWLNGQLQSRLQRNKGTLWLKTGSADKTLAQQDKLSVRVYRLINDSIPAQVTTQLELEVSGVEREVVLAPAQLSNSRTISINSPLPAKLEQDGRLRIQVKAGRWKIIIQSRLLEPLAKLSYLNPSANWPEQEIWSYQAQTQLHRHKLSGGQAVNPDQAGVPKAWQAYPAKSVTASTDIQFVLQHRGNPNPASNQLALEKQIWLDFDGQGFTQADQISGEMNRNWRLNSQADNQLGRATLNGEPQLITQLEDGSSGVEIHQRQVQLNTISRTEVSAGLGTVLNASGWQQNFNELSSRLQLPPGWSLLHASGADQVNHSWVSQWSLLDLFLLLIISAAVLRLSGPSAAALALLTLAVIFHRSGAPVYSWLNLVAVMALLGVVKGKVASWIETSLQRFLWMSCAALVLIWLPFAVEQVRTALYPQLEHPYHAMSNSHQAEDEVAMAGAQPQQQLSEMMMDDAMPEQEAEQFMGKKVARRLMASAPSNSSGFNSNTRPSKAQRLDKGRRIQTGPGQASWDWNQVRLNWQGPVNQGQSLVLYLAKPWMNALANLLAALLPLLLLGLLLKPKLSSLSGATRNSSALLILPLLIFATTAVNSTSSWADAPSKPLLKELEKRLTQPPACLPNCSSIQRLKLTLSDNTLTADITINSLSELAWPLPISGKQWQPRHLRLNQQTVASFYNSKQQQWLVKLPSGVNTLSLVADIAKLNDLAFSFSQPAHNLTITAPKWQRAGGDRTTLAQANSLRFQRRANLNTQQQLQAGPLPAFVVIKRHLKLDIDWYMETEVIRQNHSGPISFELPLLTGESVTDDRLKIAKGNIQVKLNDQQSRLRWRSSLPVSNQLLLTTPKQSLWVEQWQVETSNRWRIHQLEAGNDTPQLIPSGRYWKPRWQPWPGEQVQLSISQPPALAGHYLAIEQVSLKQDIGQRSRISTLRFRALSSQGQAYKFTLPEQAVLRTLSIDGRTLPLEQKDQVLTIDLNPGRQWVEVEWLQDQELGLSTRSPAINLGTVSANNNIELSLPRDRWTLLLGGPAMGPAVLIWGFLAVIVLLATALGRYGRTPIKTYEWILLGVGIGFNQLFAPVIVAAWLLTLAWRGRWQKAPSNGAFAACQIGLIVLTVMTLLVLISTITNSLLSSPDMHIIGNGSNAHSLFWFADRSLDAYPQAWVISLPLWVYRVSMLVWSLWLAFAVLRWLKWGWQMMNHHGLWFDKTAAKTNSEKAAENKPETEAPAEVESPS